MLNGRLRRLSNEESLKKDAEHRQVVVRLGTIAMFDDFTVQECYHFLSTVEVAMVEDV